MPDLPRIPQRFARPDLLIEVVCFIILLESWTYAVYVFNRLPTDINGLYSLTEVLDNKNAIWFFPLIGTLFYIGISWISSFPHKLKYKEAVTRMNARKVYSKALRKLRRIKFFLVLICAIGLAIFGYFAKQESPQLNSTLPLVSFLILIIPTLYLLYLVYNTKYNGVQT